MSYKDLENSLEILESVRLMKTLGEVYNFIQETFPDWILGTLPRYSPDYNVLQQNWEKLTSDLNVPHTVIIVVNDFEFDENHQLVRNFSEIFTRAGFSVRRKSEVVSCSVCGLAIPTVPLYEKLKEKGEIVPENWSSKCTEC